MEYTSIVLSGLPGSGKSSLVKRLSDFYNWPIHSIGQIFRQRWKIKYPNQEVSFEDRRCSSYQRFGRMD